MAHDILIRGGLLFDGTGAAGRPGDLAIREGRIAAIGADLGDDAGKVIDATGLAVTPGFIDIKTHSDFTLPINPKAESKVRQGVTTEIIGHCGFSVAPALPGKVELLRDYLSPSAPWLPFKETTFPAYLDGFPATAVNAGMLVGHNTLRLMVMGMADRPPTPDELAQMIALLEEALDAGALGLSSGLFTAPGSYAQPAEMIALCRVVKRHNAGYFTHIRDEANAGAGSGRGSDRHRRGLRRACRDRALQMLGNRQLGQGRARARHDRGRQGARARRRLRFLSLCRRQQSAQEPDAAMGAGGRRRGNARAARDSGRRASASAPTLPATGSTIGDASPRGIACRSRSRPICRSMPDARSAHSRASAARIRSIPSPTT